MKTDAQLMAAYIAGDDASFRIIFDRHAPRLKGLIIRRVREPAASDLLQQTFLQLHRARLSFRTGEDLQPWITTIALNCVREYFRQIGRRREQALDSEHENDLSSAAVDLAELEERVLNEGRMRAEVNGLPELQRRVIEMHWFEELPFAEIAKRLDASVSAVKVRAHRGYARLRDALQLQPSSL